MTETHFCTQNQPEKSPPDAPGTRQEGSGGRRHPWHRRPGRIQRKQRLSCSQQFSTPGTPFTNPSPTHLASWCLGSCQARTWQTMCCPRIFCPSYSLRKVKAEKTGLMGLPIWSNHGAGVGQRPCQPQGPLHRSPGTTVSQNTHCRPHSGTEHSAGRPGCQP